MKVSRFPLNLILACLVVIPSISAATVVGFKSAPYAFRISDAKDTLLAHPLTGGLNSSLFQFVDLDGDGDQDLFIQVDAKRILYFRNTGDRSHPQFQEAALPFTGMDVGGWFYFMDTDGDGDQDLLSEGAGGGIRLSENFGGTKQPEFRTLSDSLADSDGEIIILTSVGFIESADVDCDGDLDLLFATSNGNIRFLENRNLDSRHIPVFRSITEKYQGLTFAQFIPPLKKRGRLAKTGRVMHGSRNTVSFADVDGDGDLDIVWGDFFDSDLSLVVNEGTCKEPKYGTPSPFPVAGALRSGGANMSRFADLDGDGRLDLFVSVIGGAYMEPPDLVRGISYFSNRSSSKGIEFKLETSQLVPTFDIGSQSKPALVDIDGDGRLDLFVGNQFDTTGSFLYGKVYYYHNEGTDSVAALVRASSDYLPPDTVENPAPAFCDIDGDGDFDLFVGTELGPIRYFKNEGSATAPKFTLAESEFQDINVGRRSVPVFADMDGDGDSDLLVGEARGIIKYYENVGTTKVPNFVLRESAFQNIHTASACAPAVGDLNGDGKPDLVVGTTQSEVLVFLNAGTVSKPVFLDQAAMPSPAFFTPVLADMDGDGDLDMLGGASGGGLSYFEQQSPINTRILDRKHVIRKSGLEGKLGIGAYPAGQRVFHGDKWFTCLGRILK